MKKINMNKSELATRLALYANSKSTTTGINVIYDEKVMAIQKMIKGIESCKGSVVETPDDPARIKRLQEEILSVQEERANEIKKFGDSAEKFKYDSDDNTLYKEYYAATTDRMRQLAICKWFAAFDVDAADTTLLRDVMLDIAGKNPANKRTYINSGCKTLNANRTRTNFLQVFYGSLVEYAYTHNVIKVAALSVEAQRAWANLETEREIQKAIKASKYVK